MKIGAHMSIAGGVQNCLQNGEEAGCEVVQLFTKSNRRWKARELTEEEIEAFQRDREELGVEPVMVHMSYLINLANPGKEQVEKSYQSFLTELERAERLDVPLICFHPGSRLDDSLDEAIERVGTKVRQAIEESETERVRILLEGMAGEGSSIGHRFEHLRDMMAVIDRPDRTGICLDTAHLHAAGYSLHPDDYDETISEFDDLIGLDHLYAWHLNDTEKERGSQVDRHHHIGEGKIGSDAFRCLLTDDRMSGLPGVLETPKEDDWDKKNIAHLKELRNARSSGERAD